MKLFGSGHHSGRRVYAKGLRYRAPAKDVRFSVLQHQSASWIRPQRVGNQSRGPVRILQNIGLPEPKDSPTELGEEGIVPNVSLPIIGNFRQPIGRIVAGLKPLLTFFPISPMPEVAVHENGDTSSPKN